MDNETLVISLDEESPTQATTLITLSDEMIAVVILIFEVILCNSMALFGIVANAIVMAVFYKQGVMSESSTVSLFALALCDFLVEICNVVLATSDGFEIGEKIGLFKPFYVDPEMMLFLGFRPKIVLGHMICWITAFLSFERCFSVIFPFKVKQMCFPKRSVIAIACIFAGTMFTFFPLYVNFAPTKATVNNRTFITYHRTYFFSMEFEEKIVLLNPIILRNIGIGIVIISNFLILLKIKSSKAWRKTVASTSAISSKTEKPENAGKTSRNVTQRESKLIKMISMISIIFLICTTPDMITVFLTQTELAKFGGTVKRAFYAVVFFFESINSAVNIFVYYNMSSNFNEQFKRMFGLAKTA